MSEDKVSKLEAELATLADTLSKLQLKSDKTEKELAEAKTKSKDSASESKTIFISKDRKLQKFSGKKVKEEDLSIEEWIDDANYHLKNISSVEAQIEFLFDHLSGQARDELRVLHESDRRSPAKIFDRLRTLFQDEDTIAQIQQTFYQRGQRKGESLQQYSLALLKIMDRLCKKQKSIIGNRELMLRERFIDGVLDGQLKREMRRFAMDHPDVPFQEFRTIIMRWCEDDKKIGQTVVTSSMQDVHTEANTAKEVDSDLTKLLKSQQDLLTKQQEQIDKLTKLMESNQQERPSTAGQRGRGRGMRRPFGLRGAMRAGATRGCFKCGSADHFIRACPEKEQRTRGERGL